MSDELLVTIDNTSDILTADIKSTNKILTTEIETSETLTMEIKTVDELVIELNEGLIDPYLIVENVELIEVFRPIDTEMSDTSENSVQNKVIKKYVDEKVVVVSDKHYTHTQIAAASVWTINHDLIKHPSITIVDSGGTVVIGDIEYLNLNSVTVSFNGIFSGKAYCN